MYKHIDSNASMIRIHRGDSFIKPLFINAGHIMKPIRYELQQNDLVYVGVREPNKYWEQSLIKQTYNYDSEKTEDGDLLIKFQPEETEYLIPGTYYYEIKLVRRDENEEVLEVKTVVPATLFVILN